MDLKNNYKIIDDVLTLQNIMCANVGGSKIWQSPYMGKFLSEKIRNNFDSLVKYEPVRSLNMHVHKNIEECLECKECWMHRFYDKVNMAYLDVDVLMKLSYFTPKVYRAPALWNEIKNIVEEKERILQDPEKFAELCRNPIAVPFIELYPQLIDKKNLRALFVNENAFNFIIAQGYDKRNEILKYGMEFERFYPHFNLQYCKDVICNCKGFYSSPLLTTFMENPAFVGMLTENFTEMMKKYNIYCIHHMAQHKHLWPLVLSNIEVFTSHNRHNNIYSIMNLNANENPGAVEFLKNNPHYIILESLVTNPAAKDLIEEQILKNMDGLMTSMKGQRIFNSINKNPSMIDFLKRYPEFINDHIFDNPNIFEKCPWMTGSD